MTICWKTKKLFKVKKCHENAQKTQKIKILKMTDPLKANGALTK